jgi:type VI secretion system protein ImpL
LTIKTLLFILFLYVALVWVAAVGLRSGSEIQTFGLFWTAAGIAAVLLFVILSWLYGVWKMYRARPPRNRPVSEKTPQKVHPEDAAMSALFAQANAALAKLARAGAMLPKTDVRQLPLYILAGPEGSGKTSTFANSGLEPLLAAGRATDTRRPEKTEHLNLWIAGGTLFADVSGQAFSTDADSWTRILGALRGEQKLPIWRRILNDRPSQITLRGVIGFCHVKELIGASADPQRFERYCRDWRERLRTVGEVFGTSFPVYQVITNCDAVPFFPDYFRRAAEGESNQVFGSTLPLASEEFGTTASAGAKALTNSFRTLYRSIAERRIVYLANEPDTTARAAIYEFPRELKRIRSSLVQFLTDAFRGSLAEPGPRLRGYYLTGVCEAETGREANSSAADWTVADLDASRMFRGDATRMFRANDFPAASKPGAKGRHSRWLFVADLFRRVIPADIAVPQAPVRDSQIERYRRVALAGIAGFCVLLCTGFAVSWAGNRSLLEDVQTAAEHAPGVGQPAATLTSLQSLEKLRVELQNLRNGPGFTFHLGLYSGDRIFPALRDAYFKRFQHLLLNGINARLVEKLAAAPSSPDVNTPDANKSFDPLYRTLKTHLMITSGACQAEPRLVAAVLKSANQSFPPDTDKTAWQALADRQIDFYASELPQGNPCRLSPDADACSRARQYLQKVRGVNGLYATIVSNAERSLTAPKRLADLAPGYQQILTGPPEMSAVFTPEGWSFVEKASKDAHLANVDSCALGNQQTSAGDANEIQRMFIRDYIDHWLKYLSGFSVVRYSSAQDAATKLAVLADHKSPLLALLAMTSDGTDFKPSGAATIVDRGSKYLDKFIGKTENKLTAGSPLHPLDGFAASSTDITRSFQPVQWVVPPGSEKWVVDSNAAYVEALAQLGHSMQDIAAKSSDPGVIQTANQNYDKALDSVRQIAKGFKPVEVQGIDGVVQRLLEEPIQHAKLLIPTDPGQPIVAKINADVRNLCQTIGGTLRKYPFQSSSRDDAGLGELGVFAPATGAIWKFQAQSLADILVKDATGWKVKDPSNKLLPTQELLNFLNRAQAISDALYAGGATWPHFSYILRPRMEGKDLIVGLEVDGQHHEWTTSLQHTFTWPTPQGVKPGAVARIRNGALSVAFASRDGIWGILRIIGDAEPRLPSSNTIEWKYTRGKDGGRPEEIQPAPVRLDLVRAPGEIDVFSPKFFEELRCPVKAIQPTR